MHLTDNDYEVIELILKTEEIIYDFYFENDPKKNIDSLIEAIYMEADFISFLNINRFKLLEVESLIRREVQNLPHRDLLVGTSPILDKFKYPYFRMYVKLDSIVRSQSERDYKNVFIDKEVENLYKMLIDESNKTDKEVSVELRKLAYSSLLDSTTVELEMLSNDLEPFENITTASNYERFKKVYETILLRILYDIKFIKSDKLEGSSDFISAMCYLKTSLLHLSPAFREIGLSDLINAQSLTRTEFEKESLVAKKYILQAYKEVNDISYIHYLGSTNIVEDKKFV